MVIAPHSCAFTLQRPREEPLHHRVHFRVIEPMPAALDDVQPTLHASRLQRRLQELALIVRNQRISVPVHNQKGRVVFRNVGNRVGVLYRLVILVLTDFGRRSI